MICTASASLCLWVAPGIAKAERVYMPTKLDYPADQQQPRLMISRPRGIHECQVNTHTWPVGPGKQGLMIVPLLVSVACALCKPCMEVTRPVHIRVVHISVSPTKRCCCHSQLNTAAPASHKSPQPPPDSDSDRQPSSMLLLLLLLLTSTIATTGLAQSLA